ncbi:cation:proton antiporter [Thermoplasmatales archaeon ex4484_6]|nr:MAG: cation:proton antiporter [Thermoplasmatales archaeon ex4484_6]RLF69137.1 MAG: cation:proton antiporter [Thermoplasmata archaeon]
MDGWTIAMIVLLAISIFFILLGTIGLHRFPDVYTRLHAATKTTTFGSIFLIAAVIVYGAFRLTEVSGDNAGSFMHLIGMSIIALLALLFTNPTGAHAIARAARRTGVEPEQAVIDDYREVK